MLRVLFVDHAEGLGGAEHSLLLLLAHLDRQRLQPLLAANPGPLAQAARKLAVPVEEVAMPRLRGELAAPWRLARGVAQLARLIRRAQVDLVVSNVMRSSFYAALAARLTRRPLVWYVRDIFTPGLYVRWMARHAAQAIAVSRAAAAPLPRRLPVEVVPNGVDLGAFDPSAEGRGRLRAAWGVPPEAPLVGMVGRLARWKGQEDFLRAMGWVRTQHPQAHFALIGGALLGEEPDYLQALQQLARQLGLEDRIIWAGHRQDMPAVLAALDVLVHCSREPEPFGRVVIEGMAARLPVVAYRQGGPAEIVLDGETGLLVPPGDVAALARAVGSLLADLAWARQLGVAGRRRAEREYDIHILAAKVEAILERVAHSPRHGGG